MFSDKRKFFVLLIVFGIIFLGLLIKEVPFGVDPIYFFGVSCGWYADNDLLLFSKFFFENLPCNLIVFKFVGFLLTFSCFLVLWKTGELVDKEFGWLASLFSVVTTGFVLPMFFFEDDLLAFPFLFLANYFFVKGFLKKEFAPKLFSLGLVLFVGLFIWRGAFLYLLAYSFFFWPASVLLLFSFVFIPFDTMLANFLPSFDAVENYPILGLGTLGFGWIGLGVFLIGKLWIGLPFLFFGLLKSKYLIHFGFWLGLGFVFFARFLNVHPKFKARFGVEFTSGLSKTLSFWCFLIACGLALNVVFFQPPLDFQVEAVKSVVELSSVSGKPILNDWSYGYWIRFFGGVPSNEGGGGWVFAEPIKNSVVLTEKNVDLSIIDCDLNGYYGSVGYSIKTYSC